MTEPKLRTIHRGGSRYYIHPETGEKIPGVTSVINMLPKTFLQFWSAKVVAEYAINHLGDMVNIVLNGDAQGAIDYLKGAPRRDTAQAARTGSLAHEAFDHMLLTGSRPAKVQPEVLPFVLLFERFIEDQQPEILRREQTVYSEEHDYMGSFDGYGSIKLTNGAPAWFDWKTTRSGVHAEVALQLSAYRFSQWIIEQDGSTTDTPPARGGIVVHVRPEKLQVIAVECGTEVFEHFLALRKTFRWEGLAQTVLSQPEYETTPADFEVVKPVRRARKLS